MRGKTRGYIPLKNIVKTESKNNKVNTKQDTTKEQGQDKQQVEHYQLSPISRRNKHMFVHKNNKKQFLIRQGEKYNGEASNHE